MFALWFIVVFFVVCDLVAWLRGYYGSDGIDSTEWERRQHWYGFH